VVLPTFIFDRRRIRRKCALRLASTSRKSHAGLTMRCVFLRAVLRHYPGHPIASQCPKAFLRRTAHNRKCLTKSVILTCPVWPFRIAACTGSVETCRCVATPIHGWTEVELPVFRIGLGPTRRSTASGSVRRLVFFAGPTPVSNDFRESFRYFLSRPAPDTGGQYHQ
jgi:hypothetical protein